MRCASVWILLFFLWQSSVYAMRCCCGCCFFVSILFVTFHVCVCVILLVGNQGRTVICIYFIHQIDFRFIAFRHQRIYSPRTICVSALCEICDIFSFIGNNKLRFDHFFYHMLYQSWQQQKETTTNYNKQAQRVIWYKTTMTTATVYKSDTNNKNVQPVIEVDNRIRKKTPITKRVQRIRISSKLMMTSFAPHFYADFFLYSSANIMYAFHLHLLCSLRSISHQLRNCCN